MCDELKEVVWYVFTYWRNRNLCSVLMGEAGGIHSFEVLHVVGRMILKLVLKNRIGGHDMD
jgi:hypothetical protein